MKIEIKNLKLSRHLSEETNAFTATVYVDGQKAFDATNHGQGGPDAYYPCKTYTGPCEREIDQWIAANHPKIDVSDIGGGEPLTDSLEMVVGRLIEQVEGDKEFAKLLKKVVILRDDKITCYPARFAPTPENIAKVRATDLKGGEIVNGGDVDLLARAKKAFGL